jgi:tRNA dimethylallyltransferase
MDAKRPYRAILIAGPTASGKSALAIGLALRHRGIVVNADSMQVYRELAVLTARPSAADMERVPHALYGHVPAAEPYSVGRWLDDVEVVLSEAWSDGLIPIVVGGTGLYFRALLEGLSPVPPVPATVREHWRAQARRLGAPGLHAVLKRRDPAMAERLRPSDTQRLTRALEVLEATGRSLSDWQRQPGRGLLQADETERLVVAPDRSTLFERADARLDWMIEAGALEEVRALLALGLDPGLPAMRALGVPPLIEAVTGRLSPVAALARAKLDTRHYIRRQQTWLKRNMMSWKTTKTE